VDEGRIAVLSVGGELSAFDLPSGAPRPGPRLRIPEGRSELPLRESGHLVEVSEPTCFAWDPRTNQSVRVEGASSCAFDERRGRLAALHKKPHASRAGALFDLGIEVRTLGKDRVVRASLGTTQDETTSIIPDESTGLFQVHTFYPEQTMRLVDPETGRPADWRKHVAHGLASFPVREAHFGADLGAVAWLERPDRKLVPQFPPGRNIHAGAYANGVRTADGKTIAVIDMKKDPRSDDDEDRHLLLADVAKRSLRADVPMRMLNFDPWQTIQILGERYVAGRLGWTVTVVDLDKGQLRATVDAGEAYGRVALVPGGFLVSGGALYDLSLPRQPDRGTDALIDLGFAPRDLQYGKSGDRVWPSEPGKAPAVKVTFASYELAEGVAPPGWIHCFVDGWILPLDACSHRLEARN
jgi:hypothetical protein